MLLAHLGHLDFSLRPRHFLLAGFVALLALGAFDATRVRAATIKVTNLNDSGFGSLRQAIFDAGLLAGPDTITFEMDGTITLASSLPVITTQVIIDATGRSVTVSGGNTLGVRPFTIQNVPVNLIGLTITGGNNNDIGGGVFNDGGTLAVYNSTIHGNRATSGAGIFNAGAMSVYNSTISGNTATITGGGIYGGTTTLVNTTVANNTAAVSGGGLRNFGATFAWDQVLVAGNSAPDGPDCKGDFVPGGTNTMGFLGNPAGCSTIQLLPSGDAKLGPLADNGGPTRTHALLAGSPAIDQWLLACPTGTDQRGITRPQGAGCDYGAYEVVTVPSSLTVTNLNNAGAGSLRQAIVDANQSTADQQTITFNVSGTIALATSLPAITGPTNIDASGRNIIVSGGNQSGVRPFEIASGASVMMRGFTVTGGNNNGGGGVFSLGSLTLDGMAIVRNTVSGGGGGVTGGGSTAISNSTISGNSAVGSGGGIFVTGVATLANTTVSGNTSSGAGGGLARSVPLGGAFLLQQSLVAGNTAPASPDCEAVNLTGPSFIGSTVGCTVNGAALTGDAKLGPLATNSGPTETHALLPGSPALNAGSATCASDPVLGRDQRGVTRAQGTACDLGAFENRLPVAVADTATVQPGQQITINVLANDTDPEGNLLAVTRVLSPPTAGTATAGPTSITYTAGAGVGTATFTYEITDGAAGVATSSVTVTTSTTAATQTPVPTSTPVGTPAATATPGPTPPPADTDGGVSVTFPTDTFGPGVSIATGISNAAPPAAPVIAGQRLLPILVTLTSPQQPARLVSVTVNLTSTQMNGAAPATFLAAVLTPAGPRFLPIRVLDTSLGVVTFDTDRLGTIAFYSVASPRPSSPTALSALQGQETPLTGIGVNLSWTNPAGALYYNLQVVPFNDDGPGIDLVVGDPAQVAAAAYRVSAPVMGTGGYLMLPDLSYIWRIRTATVATFPTEVDWSPWATSSFRTTKVNTATLNNVSPATADQVQSLTPALTWSNSDPRVFYYEVQMSKDPQFGNQAFLYWELLHAGVSQPLNTYQVPAKFPLEAATTYHWRVRPRIQGDGVPLTWGPTWTFSTP